MEKADRKPPGLGGGESQTMTGDRPLVQVGDPLELREGDYLHGSGPYEYGEA